jgi:hypothetical protein
MTTILQDMSLNNIILNIKAIHSHSIKIIKITKVILKEMVSNYSQLKSRWVTHNKISMVKMVEGVTY